MSERGRNEAGLDELLRALPAAPTTSCPDPARWIDLARGELDPGAAETLRDHLTECPACVERARDARRFLAALGEPAAPARPTSAAVRLAVAASVLAALATLLLWPAARSEPAAVDRLAAGLELPPAPPEPSALDRELVFRGGPDAAPEAERRHAYEPYRRHDLATACVALGGLGERYPAEREARFAAAVSCLKAGRYEHGERLLAALAAGAGARRDDSRALLERLRAARAQADP